MSKNSNSCGIYINGELFQHDKALININDRGFRYGDGVFETIRVNDGNLFRFNSHLQRLESGLKAIKVDFDVSKIEASCHDLLNKNQIVNGFLRISISRGEGSLGYLPKEGNKPTIVMQTVEMGDVDNKPVDLWLSSYRKIPDICLPANIKSAQGLNSTLARMEARENKCFEALLLSVDGKICEGSSGNIFWFKGGKLYTPENNILKGVMREAVIEKSPYDVVTGDFDLDELSDAEEVFMTNVAWVIKPIASLQPEGIKWQETKVSEQMRELVL